MSVPYNSDNAPLPCTSSPSPRSSSWAACGQCRRGTPRSRNQQPPPGAKLSYPMEKLNVAWWNKWLIIELRRAVSTQKISTRHSFFLFCVGHFPSWVNIVITNSRSPGQFQIGGGCLAFLLQTVSLCHRHQSRWPWNQKLEQVHHLGGWSPVDNDALHRAEEARVETFHYTVRLEALANAVHQTLGFKIEHFYGIEVNWNGSSHRCCWCDPPCTLSLQRSCQHQLPTESWQSRAGKQWRD